MSQFESIHTDFVYRIRYVNDKGIKRFTTLITNLKCGSDREQMTSDLSWLFGQEVVQYNLL